MNLVQNFERMWKQLGIATMRDSLTPVKIRKAGSVTVVFWNDGTATSVRCSADDTYDDYVAFCAALTKRVLGSNSAVKRFIHDCPVEIADKMNLKSFAASVDMMSMPMKEYTFHVSSVDVKDVD